MDPVMSREIKCKDPESSTESRDKLVTPMRSTPNPTDSAVSGNIHQKRKTNTSGNILLCTTAVPTFVLGSVCQELMRKGMHTQAAA